MHILSLFSRHLKESSSWKCFDLDYVLEYGDKTFKMVFEDKKSCEYFVVHELPPNFPLEGTVLMFLSEDKAIFTCDGYSVATIWAENNVLLFDSLIGAT